MERRVNMEEISDGKRYTRHDMVRADCRDCEGCSACCHGMGNTIQLDPMDVYRLSQGLGIGFPQMLSSFAELGVADGIILPNLRMDGPQEACPLLSAEGRCSIHPFRPGICRLFPLGRLYENGTFTYFLQTGECVKRDRTKVRVSRWVDTPDLVRYEKYITDWHYFVKDLQDQARAPGGEALAKTFSMYVLETFYMKDYDTENPFYPQFYQRFRRGRP